MSLDLSNISRYGKTKNKNIIYSKLIYKYIKTNFLSWSILSPSRETSDTMQKLFYVFAGYVGLGLISFTAITSSLDSSTRLHCSNGIQSACDYLARSK